MKPTTKILLLFLAVIMSLIFTSCEKDLYEDAIKENSKFKYEVLRGFNAQKSFYKLKQKLNKKEESTLDTRNRIFDFNIGTISYDEVIKVVDSLGKENYTFEVLHPLTSDTKFFNLVLQEKDNSYVIKLLEYTMTEEFSNQYKINHDLTNFKGTLISYTIYNETPCPEPDLLINIGEVPMNSNIGGGSGDNSGIPSSGPGIGDNSGHGTGGNLTVMLLALDWSIIDPSSSNNNSGENQLQHHIILWRTSETINTNNENSEPVDPCANNTQIGVLAPVDKCSKTFLEGLRNEERMWLYNHNDILNELMDFISKSANCEEANTLANEILKELIKGGKYNSKNNIVLDSTFVSNQKVNCVFNKLITQNNSFFKDLIINSFASSKTAFLKFDISSIPQPTGGIYQAITKPIYNNGGNSFYKITLDSNFVNSASTIEIAFAIIHETIHAELIERCIKLNLIDFVDNNGNVKFFNNPLIYSDNRAIFQQLIQAYYSYNGTINPEWNHELFNVFNYRSKMQDNLIDIHQYLNDSTNDFLTLIVNDPNIQGGTYSLQDLMYYTSWIGLEGTSAYNSIFNDPTNPNEIIRKNYTEIVINTKYNHNCN